MKCLVVDDSGLSRRLMRRHLEELGHEVVEVDDGFQALEKYALEKPDIVMLDLLMPGMTGFEVLSSLRALDPASRIIICSADIQKATRQKVQEGGALAMINKPVTIEQIATTLNEMLSERNAWQIP